MATNKAPGVVTKNDVEKKSEVTKPEAAPKAAPGKVIKRRPATVRHRVKFGPAPLGKSVTNIVYNGEGRTINMVDGFYEFPENMDEGKVKAFKQHLIGLGFTDASVTVNGESYEEDAPPPKKFSYSVAHPDRVKGIKMTGNVSVQVKNKPVALKFEDGVIHTKDKDLRDALVSGGWIEIAASEIVSEQKEEPKKEPEKEDGGKS